MGCQGVAEEQERQEPVDGFASATAVWLHCASPGTPWEGAPSDREKAVLTSLEQITDNQHLLDLRHRSRLVRTAFSLSKGALSHGGSQENHSDNQHVLTIS